MNKMIYFLRFDQIARFFLGLGIGPKSSTVPVYAAECSPAPIRGALVMMWQMFTAFGIMVGYAMDLAFLKVPDTHNIHGLNWRLMLASVSFRTICCVTSCMNLLCAQAGVPALIVMSQVFFCPESPRWLMGRGRYADAYRSLERLRRQKIQAARDLYCS